MSTDFNWQTEEDRWVEKPVTYEKEERPKKSLWPTILVVILITSVITLLIYRQVRRQIEAAVSQTEDDVRRTHELVLQAAEKRDRDLLNSMISSRDDGWLNQQLELAQEGLLFNPKPLGLVSQKEASARYEFDLSADLNEADVFTIRSFTVQSPAGVSETIELKQHALYRRGENRWLYSPPKDLDAFWEGFITKEGEYLTITYPTRDAGAVEPLIEYLETKLAEMCTELPDFSCADNFQFFLKLETDPTGQIDLLDMESVLNNAPPPDISLPTLTLVGLPIDEAGEDALYRGYATRVIQVAMVNALDWDCCQRGLFFRALLDYQLAELGLSPYPMHPADYEQLFSRFQQLDQFSGLWSSGRVELKPSNDWQWAYALTEFVLSTPISDKTAGAMQESLLEADSYLAWLRDLLSREVTTDLTVQHAWLNFIYGKSLSGQVAEGDFTPTQDILLSCENDETSGMALYRYDWETSDWLIEDRFAEKTLFMMSMPDDSAVLIQQIGLVDPGTTFMWQNGQTISLLDNSDPELEGYFFIGLMSPNGRKLIMTKPDGQAGYSLLDLDNCNGSDCRLDAIPGIPEWSPDGTQMLFELIDITDNIWEVVGIGKINSAGQKVDLSRQGYSPFWFSNEEYGFVSFGRDAGVYIAQNGDDDPYLLLSAEDLLETFPEEERPDSLNIQSVIPNPANRNILAITAYSVGVMRYEVYLLFWNRQTGEINQIALIERIVVGFSEWLPGGEWLVVPTFDNRQPVEGEFSPWSYYLFHISGDSRPIEISRGQDLAFPFLDNSIDSEWLVISKNHYLELIGLRHPLPGNLPYRRVLSHDFDNCQNAVFIG